MTKHALILRHVAHEPAGTLENALNKAGVEFRYLDLFAEHPECFDFKDILGLVVMGGPMNVDEVDRIRFWPRTGLDPTGGRPGLPLLGICLGSQLLAKALGARVYPNGIKEIGWYPLELTAAAAEDRLFAGCGPESTVFQWHGDTFDLPPGAVHLAQSPLCRNQAFRIGPSAYGLQFHIEMTAEMIDDWLAESGNSRELASGLYRSANNPPKNSARIAAPASASRKSPRPIRRTMPRPRTGDMIQRMEKRSRPPFFRPTTARAPCVRLS